MPAVGFKLSVSGAKKLFFDRKKVQNMVDRKTLNYLRHAGGYVRLTARRSIRNAPRRRSSSQAAGGTVPRNQVSVDAAGRLRIAGKFASTVQVEAYHAGRPIPANPGARRSPTGATVSRPGQPPLSHTGLLKKYVLFSFESGNKSVVIGPAKLNQKTDAPAALEHGGIATVQSFRRGPKRKVRIAARPYMAPALTAATTREKTKQFWQEAGARA